MRVDVVHCGPFANESEQKAVEALKSRLIGELGGGRWLLLTNLAFSANHRRQSDEIDIIVIGPPGARVVEVKHWTSSWVRKNRELVDHEADRVTAKARKVGAALRRKVADVGYVDGVFLVTQATTKVKQIDGEEMRGVPFHTINSWRQVLGLERHATLTDQQVQLLGQTLWPKASVALDGTLKAFAGYTALTLLTPPESRFHRSYRGVHSKRRNGVILHVYDTSASDDPNAEVKARREFDALHRLQLHAWAPRVEDSFHEAPGYAGEMWFFTVADPAAPTIEERAVDDTWSRDARIEFARRAVSALAQLHGSREQKEPMLHRNLTPVTILVKHDNSPILTGFEYARIPADQTVSLSGSQRDGSDIMAPEVRVQGTGAADVRSDTYSLCASLSVLFDQLCDDVSNETKAVLALGMDDDPANRATLEKLDGMLSEKLGESPPQSPDLPARFWTEDQVIHFRNRDYRIVSRLGSGGIGTTFKVVGIDRASGTDLGAYVAKVVHDEETGRRVLRSYNLARSHLHHSALSIIFETADDWHDNGIVALMTWVEGEPLSNYAGVLPIHAEDLNEESGEALALRWLRTLCEALDVLHRNGLVHGDVSPRNMIVAGSDIVLTDYDCVSKVGEPRIVPGTVLYSSYTHLEDTSATPADDLFSLAASFFQVLFDEEPFSYDGKLAKERGLNWAKAVEREEYPTVAAFMDRATHADPARRFASVVQAKAMLTPPASASGTGSPDRGVDSDPCVRESPRSENEVPWLRFLLQSYPGSKWGNSETRGLDTDFAEDTYVETPLEESLLKQIRERKAKLVILCGNAGDGKTALLQHLARQLGLGHKKSETRILRGRMDDGLMVRVNLDGSASWRGRSADELLDEFLAPFEHGPPSDDIAHLLAVNDGRLLEWIERVETGGEGTSLTKSLTSLLDGDGTVPPAHIRFINLNQRSLVGGVTTDGRIQTAFLERLIESLYGGDNAGRIWTPCGSCSAEERCEVRKAMKWFGPSELHDSRATEHRIHARQRLFDALQAVHLRGETHITVRELRASLVYILFGTHYCADYHRLTVSNGGQPQAYWDRAFAPDSEARQGEVLRELIRLDPALEAHPKVDRFLSRTLEDGETLGSARRRAYFEMSQKSIEAVAGRSDSLGLARGQHIAHFRDLPIRPDTHGDLCRRLCAGISRLEDLPPQAIDHKGVVPLRVTPRTPTETAFWVEKSLGDFRLEAGFPPGADGLGRLHREAQLVYRYRDGKEERLRLAADLFHVLLELGAGYQLGDVSTDDTFAQLAIFVQRLVREDERRVLAWNPMQDDAIYEISARIIQVETQEALQHLHLRRLEE